MGEMQESMQAFLLMREAGVGTSFRLEVAIIQSHVICSGCQQEIFMAASRRDNGNF
jgi:hypothetical protein